MKLCSSVSSLLLNPVFNPSHTASSANSSSASPYVVASCATDRADGGCRLRLILKIARRCHAAEIGTERTLIVLLDYYGGSVKFGCDVDVRVTLMYVDCAEFERL